MARPQAKISRIPVFIYDIIKEGISLRKKRKKKEKKGNQGTIFHGIRLIKSKTWKLN